MIRTRFNLGARKSALKCTHPTLCQSHLASQTDIATMIKRAIMGDQSVFRRPQYLDALSAPETFQDAQNKLALARSVWEDLPESVKAAYGGPDRLLQELDNFKPSPSDDPVFDPSVKETTNKPETPVTAEKPADGDSISPACAN